MTVGLILGSIQFMDREIPDHINFGGKQMLAVHKNIGGSRVIDAMGPDPDDIKWAGKFYSFNGPSEAASRARACDSLRQSGRQVWLTWGSFSYLVVVRHFEANYKHEWEIPYQIICTVVQDGPARSFQVSLDSAVQNDIKWLQIWSSQATST